ncbi:voltage-gated chloride channel [Amylibacter kogurei]|uniref:Voltage-gated chloride channel n=1 Tax=Paramylibacter kogurei TaxID=1889778 RepID=A0A2G5K6A3_9RHOB|nr:chloride channel protein [Amylibacter kogurei]PIB25068.1 voltage-gated chloride channel [Amylibacter kogurei]
MTKAAQDSAPAQTKFWLIALFLGIAAGLATVAFRLAISEIQAFLYGADDLMLASTAQHLPWFWVLVIPIIGGLIVGLILHRFTPDASVRAVANVIEGAALDNGRVEGRAGLASTIASLITLSTGGSTGREGPAVLLGALISSKVAKWMNADGITGRDLLGCAVAAAVSASFNAPIAGAIFALEVVLRHFAVHAFAPITIASVAGTVVGRLSLGNTTEFSLPPHAAEFYIQLPAFMMLGIVCGFVAVIMMRGIFWAEDFGNLVVKQSGLPRWARPAFAGALLGMIAIFFPHIIGVGYETTSNALTGHLTFFTAVVFAVVKVIAVAITMAGRMGGGVFSPALMLGALTGLAFGWVATSVVPSVAGDESLYALAGMGAVAAAVLGAPISTSLIVFEMTGDWQAGLAVMVAVSLSSAVASNLVHRSFFLTQLERKGVHLAAGPQSYLLATFKVTDLMQPLTDMESNTKKSLWDSVEDGVYLDASTTLEVAMPMFESGARGQIPIVQLGADGQGTELLGALKYVDALTAYNRALAETAREEHS